MSEIIEHPMPYIPFRLDGDAGNMYLLATAVSKNMLIVHERTLDNIRKNNPMAAPIMAGHMIILKDHDTDPERFRPQTDVAYPDEHGYSRVYADDIDQAIGHAATLRDLVRMVNGVMMGLVVLDYADSDLIGELRESGYAPKADA